MRKLNNIGQAIRFVRMAKGLSQEEMSAKVDLSDTTISLIENGHRFPSWDALLNICTGLDVSLTLLVMLTEKDHPFVRPLIPLAYSELANLSQQQREMNHAAD